MQDLSTKTIREIALEAPLSTRIFEEYKIDFCCGGRVPFDEACQNAGVDPAVVKARLDAMLVAAGPEVRSPERLSPTELIAQIIDKHHVFTRSEIARLVPLAEKVASRHGDTRPELAEIRDVFGDLAEELLVHMRKEEAVLFPFIEQLDAAASGRLPAPLAHFGTVQNPIRMMLYEHDRAGELLRDLRALSVDYTAPEWACPSYRALFAGLQDLERDLHQHIHLENNVLFPQAIEMETELFGTSAGSSPI
ncbi:MAG: iron-sulfur cluster repair di-iron protein [Pyrinomonadaceae bacterium]